MEERFLSLGLAAIMATPLTAYGGSNTVETAKAAETTTIDAKVEGSEAADTAATDVGAVGGVFKIGSIGPITGGTAVYGVAVQRGAELTVKEINEAGGVNGVQVEFNFQDNEYNVEKSVNVYNTSKGRSMQVLMGTVTSALCIVVADRTVADSMLQITPSGSVIEYAANPNVFRICLSDSDQGAASAKYIDGSRLASKVTVIYDSSNVYSGGIYERFAEKSANQGIKIVAAEAFTADSNKDFSTQLQKAKDAGAELVFLPIYHAGAFLIFQRASIMGFAPQFFECDGIDDILQVQSFDTKLVEGLMLLTSFMADATDDLTVKLVESYKAAYNRVPVQFAADTYDIIYAIKAAIEDASVTPDVDTNTICSALKASMSDIKLGDLTGEGMTWTGDGGLHKAPRTVKAVDGAYSTM